MPLALNVYTLPRAATDVPLAVRQEYRASGFSQAVRDWHLERIPRLTVGAGQYIVCPWCNKQKDFRSTQIDHVIPARVYARHQLYGRFAGIGHGEREVRETLGPDAVKAAYNDPDNLLLCCTKCNSGESDTMPTTQGVQGAINRQGVSQLAARLARLNGTLAAIHRLPTRLDGVDVHEWVLGGANWNTSPMQTRSSGGPIRHRVIRTQRHDPMPSRLRTRLSLLENVVIRFFVHSRPAFTIAASTLAPQQRRANFVNEEHRLCFYCLGLFKKQAFQIDHIDPASRQGFPTPDTYSDPRNLIPVCRTCNTSKGLNPLTTVLVEGLIALRQRDGEPGIETSTLPLPVGHADLLAYGRSERRRVLGV